MKKQAGLWIDHREAVIVVLTDKDEKSTHIRSDAEKQTRFPGARKHGLQKTEAVRDKRLEQDLGKYFDDVTANIREAGSIQ
jgi:hypothetical protein